MAVKFAEYRAQRALEVLDGHARRDPQRLGDPVEFPPRLGGGGHPLELANDHQELPPEGTGRVRASTWRGRAGDQTNVSEDDPHGVRDVGSGQQSAAHPAREVLRVGSRGTQRPGDRQLWLPHRGELEGNRVARDGARPSGVETAIATLGVVPVAIAPEW